MKDLVPVFSDGAWRSYEPPHRKNADFCVSEDGMYVSIHTVPDFGVGKYIGNVAVDGGEYYDLSARCKTDLSECDAYLILTQYTERGKTPIREHCKHTVRDGDYLCFSDRLDIHKDAVRLEIELWIKGKDAYGIWELPTLRRSEPLPKRSVRLAPIHMKWTSEISSSEQNEFEAYMTAVDKAGSRGADIIVLGECMYGRGLGSDKREKAQILTPKMIKALAEKAIRYNTYIVYNGVEEENDHYFNTSFLIGRGGELIGKYRKTHITVSEYEEGMTPGDELPVFDLDFGRVGLLTCYDQFFPETARELVRRGAELICIPTAGDDSHCCMALAMYYGVYLAVAGMNNENEYGWGATRVVDPLGRLLAHTDENLESAYAEIDLSKKVRRFWMSTGPAESEVRGDYRYEVNPHCFK